MTRHYAAANRHRPITLVQIQHVAIQEVAQALAWLQIHRDVALAFQCHRVRRQHQLTFICRCGHQTHA